MEAFMGVVREYWPIIFFLWIYTIMRGGRANRAKYKRWDALRAKRRQNTGKKQAKYRQRRKKRR